jgi:hypothetical protein
VAERALPEQGGPTATVRAATACLIITTAATAQIEHADLASPPRCEVRLNRRSQPT